MEYLITKWLHILSSTFLFGTGVGSAYYMFLASRTRDPKLVAFVVRRVVWADWLFTATTVVFQPLSGWYLAHLMQLPLSTPWVLWSLVLYAVAGACWLPVVWLQIRMLDMADEAVRNHQALPPLYVTYHRLWTTLGFPAFIALVIVFYLMVVKPT